MSTFLKNLLENNEKISFQKILASIFCIAMIRFFLEIYSSPDPSGHITLWNELYLNFPLFYLSTFLSFSLLLYLFTKSNINNIFSFLIPVQLFILLVPFVDLLVSKGKGILIFYTITSPQNFPAHFFNLLRPFSMPGITPGIHVAGFFLLLSVTYYIYHKTNSVLRSTLGAISGYIIFYFYTLLPSFLILNSSTSSILPPPLIYLDTLSKSLLSYTRTSFIQLSNDNQITMLNAISLSQLFWIFIAIQSIILFVYTQRKAVEILKATIRTERILNYLLIAGIGMLISSTLFGFVDLRNHINVLSLIMFFLLLSAILIWETFINDAEDIEIDQISNVERPLAKKIISLEDWNRLSNSIGVLIIIGLFLVNQTTAFFLVLLLASYYIYSAKPLRLKKHFISSSILIGLATVSTTMAGFFFVSPDQKLSSFPLSAILIIGIVQALLSNLKDIKDYAGDKKEGIRTMPVVFGEKKAKIIIASMYSSVFIFLPIFFNFKPLFYVGLIASFSVFYFLTKKKYEEKYVFMIMFLYMFCLYLAFTAK